MRIALVSPYSWTYPGGVTRHIEALAEQLRTDGHEPRVLAPLDPDDRLSALLHHGHRPQGNEPPDYLIPLGRTVGLPANGAVSNIAVTPHAITTLRRELATGGFDVVHVHEPGGPILGWDGSAATRGPLVGTFHCYSDNRVTNNIANVCGVRRVLNRLHVRIAVSEAAAWTGRRFFGGHYRIIPNGVDLDSPPPPKASGAELRIAFVGQAVGRKGLPVLLRAFEALREHLPVRLEVIGASAEQLAPMLLDARGVIALGKVSDAEKHAALARADVLCAPSLGGESFGMVLTEAFAAGTPVVASDIAGYRDVVRDGVDGVLVAPGDAAQLAEALRALWHEPERRVALGRAATEHVQRFAWPRVAAEVVHAYEDAIALPEARTRLGRAAVRIGAVPADLEPRSPAEKLPTLEPAAPGARRGTLVHAARRAAIALGLVAGVVVAVLALGRIGLDNVAGALLDSSPAWVLAGLGLMCGSMVLRAVSWSAILRAALPDAGTRLRDAMQGTFIGVLMSATLPARLGEPSRALVVARRTGRPRDHLPVVLGTLVSQTVLNIVALTILGAVMFGSVGLFRGHHGALLAASAAPLVLLVAVLLAPGALRLGAGVRFARLRELATQLRNALSQVRSGLAVFRRPRLGAEAAAAQLGAWATQWIACYVLLVALGLDGRAGIGAAAAVLFAVNVTAVLPAIPSNLGIFQAACVAVLHGAYGVSTADALGYGIVLQAVEIATALVMGMPALLAEGLSWRDVRQRALHAAPVTLPGRPGPGRPGSAVLDSEL